MPTQREGYAVLGLSQFGLRTAMGLFERGARVLAIDRDPIRVQRASQHVTKAVQADVMDLAVLSHVGAFDVHTVVIGFRSAFDAAVLLAYHIRHKTDVERIVAQVDTDVKADALRMLGVDIVVFPERDTAEGLVRRLTLPDLVEQIPLSGNAAIIEVAVPEEYVGKSLAELRLRSRYGIYVIGVKHTLEGRREEVAIAPPPENTFGSGDTMLVLGDTTQLDRFAKDIK